MPRLLSTVRMRLACVCPAAACIVLLLSHQSGVMAVVTGIRSWRLHEAQGETLEELATTVQVTVMAQQQPMWQLHVPLLTCAELLHACTCIGAARFDAWCLFDNLAPCA
jgi:hypothetical protein